MKLYADDFELWARECVRIVDKETGLEMPFTLNAPQRRVLGIMERQRRAGSPVRIIMLKARQWGGSTLVQIYMAWMQMVVRRGWNSVTCAHVKDASASIRGMYTRLLRSYPDELRGSDRRQWTLAPYEKSASTLWLPARDCLVAIATSMAPNAARGYNFAMAHLSEVAFWGDGDPQLAEEIVRTVCGTVLRTPDSMIVMESTANGKDNYFYSEWQRAVEGKSDKEAVFVPWYEIEIYRRPVASHQTGRLLAEMDEYELDLLKQGVELEAVAWYHDKRREYRTHEAMMAEFPSTPKEAFGNPQGVVFEASHIPLSSSVVSRPQLAVFIPGHASRRGVVSLFSFSRNGGVTALCDSELSADPSEAVADVAVLAKHHDVEVMVVETPGGEPSHARWTALTLMRRGVSAVYDDDEHPYHIPDADTLSQWVDTLRELLHTGQMMECDTPRDEYLAFRHTTPWRTPRVLARLGAASYAHTRHHADDFSSLYTF